MPAALFSATEELDSSTAVGASWRWLEHTGWVAFEDVFLVYACWKGENEVVTGGRFSVDKVQTEGGVMNVYLTQKDFSAH